MKPLLRTRCPICGRPSGVVIRQEGQLYWRELERFNYMTTWRRGDRIGAWGGRPPLDDWDWTDREVTVPIGPTVTAEMSATCRDGHELVVDLGAVARAALAGVRNLTLATPT